MGDPEDTAAPGVPLLRIAAVAPAVDLEQKVRDCCVGEYGLSPRETEVVLLLADGRTNADIAVVLGLSPRTVARHLSQIFDKVGIRTRAGVVGNILTGALVGHAAVR